jgi:hypothetical protein
MSTKGPSLSQLEALLTAEGDVPENAFSQLADFLKDSQSIDYEAFASQSVEAFASFSSQFLNDEVDLPTHPSRVEGAHSCLKANIRVSTMDLYAVWNRIEAFWNRQMELYDQSMEISKTMTPSRAQQTLFSHLLGRV